MRGNAAVKMPKGLSVRGWLQRVHHIAQTQQSQRVRYGAESRSTFAGQRRSLDSSWAGARAGGRNRAVEIEDDGPGTHEATQKRVLEPLLTTNPTDRGTSLGLSVSYFIVTEDHGGEISVESRPGESTNIIVRLPDERKVV